MKKLKWVYCECGCHGHDLIVGDLHFWKYWDIECTTNPETKLLQTRYGKHYLTLGGQRFMGKQLGTFDSSEQLDDFVRKHIREHRKKLADELKGY